MSMTLEEIKLEALKLSPQQRADLADVLWTSVERSDNVAAAWAAEVDRRISDMDAGRTSSIAADEVFDRVEAMIRKAGT